VWAVQHHFKYQEVSHIAPALQYRQTRGGGCLQPYGSIATLVGLPATVWSWPGPSVRMGVTACADRSHVPAVCVLSRLWMRAAWCLVWLKR
jgi:hypothetical protein